MTKSGREYDITDLNGKGARRRRRARIFRVLGLLFAGAVAVVTGSFAVAGLFSLASDQSAQSTYDKAPYCVPNTTQTTSCVLRTTASVAYVDVSRNTGKNAHGYTTKVELDPAPVGRSQTVVVSDTQDLSDQINSGDVLPVLVWHDEITRFTYSGKTHDADENPHHLVAEDLAQVALCLFAAFVFGRPLIRRLLRDRIAINLRRNRVPDWTLLALAGVVVPIAALLRASYVVVALGAASAVVLVGSLVWPFVPWVATLPAKQKMFLTPTPPSSAARNRNRPRTAPKKKLP